MHKESILCEYDDIKDNKFSNAFSFPTEYIFVLWPVLLNKI